MNNFGLVEPVAKFRSENSREYIDRYAYYMNLKVNFINMRKHNKTSLMSNGMFDHKKNRVKHFEFYVTHSRQLERE